MPKEKAIYAKINIKGGAILFTRQKIIIREAGKERPATPTEEKLARAVARFRSLWLKQIRSRQQRRTSQKVDNSDHFFALLAACVRVQEALKSRRYESASALLQAAIENAKRVGN
ncbi:MAG: hypothetical protein QXT45_07450 [Candidatus Bilamarchaeaceae archaeon]